MINHGSKYEGHVCKVHVLLTPARSFKSFTTQVDLTISWSSKAQDFTTIIFSQNIHTCKVSALALTLDTHFDILSIYIIYLRSDLPDFEFFGTFT